MFRDERADGYPAEHDQQGGKKEHNGFGGTGPERSVGGGSDKEGKQREHGGAAGHVDMRIHPVQIQPVSRRERLKRTAAIVVDSQCDRDDESDVHHGAERPSGLFASDPVPVHMQQAVDTQKQGEGGDDPVPG